MDLKNRTRQSYNLPKHNGDLEKAFFMTQQNSKNELSQMYKVGNMSLMSIKDKEEIFLPDINENYQSRVKAALKVYSRKGPSPRVFSTRTVQQPIQIPSMSEHNIEPLPSTEQSLLITVGEQSIHRMPSQAKTTLTQKPNNPL